MNPHDDIAQTPQPDASQTAASAKSAPRTRTARASWRRFFSKPAPNLALRVMVMFFGLLCIALGIAMAKHAGIGTSPISSLPAVLTEASTLHDLPMTMGAWTFVFNMLYFLLEIALLRSKFPPLQLLQIPLFFVLSVSVDAWLALLEVVPAENYVQQLALLLASIVVLAFGIRVQLASDLLMTPGDAAVQVVSYVSRRRFSSCKVAWDVTLMCLAAIASLVLLGGLFQVREGTILSAVFVGVAVRAFDGALRPLGWLIPDSKKTLIPPLCPEITGSTETSGQNAATFDELATKGNA